MLNNNIADSVTDATERDEARHSLTIEAAGQIFADRGVPRSPRSIQRFCQNGYLDCVRVKGAKGEQFFISSESAERYAEELRQIEAIASMSSESRHDAPERDTTRHDAIQRDITEQPQLAPKVDEPVVDDAVDAIKRLETENLHLRIDNRAKEQVINFLTTQAQETHAQLQDASYRLGIAEGRVAQLEAPPDDDRARQSAPNPVITESAQDDVPEPPSAPTVEAPAPAIPPRRSLFGRLFGG